MTLSHTTSTTHGSVYCLYIQCAIHPIHASSFLSSLLSFHAVLTNNTESRPQDDADKPHRISQRKECVQLHARIVGVAHKRTGEYCRHPCCFLGAEEGRDQEETGRCLYGGLIHSTVP